MTSASRTTRQGSAGQLTQALALTGVAVGVGMLVVLDVRLAILIAALPVVLVLLVRPLGAVLGGLVTLTITRSLITDPVLISLSDAFLALAGVAVLLAALLGDERSPALLKGLKWPVGVYAAILLGLVIEHGADRGADVLLQRAQIVVVPLVLGAWLVSIGRTRLALTVCLIGCSAFAVLYPLVGNGAGALGTQKNAAGQFLAGAALIALVAPSLPSRARLLTPLLVLGVLFTGSRGAFVGLAAGAAVLLVFGASSRQQRRLIGGVVAGLVMAIAVFSFLPKSQQVRFTNIKGKSASQSEDFAVRIRSSYREDALNLWRAHPVVGIGPGNYLSGNDEDYTSTTDPHNVLLLELAEGGVIGVTGFSVLVLGSLGVLFRLRRRTPWAAVAAAVMTSTVVHGQVDVYWVRGTPVLSWLLVGIAVADAARTLPAERTVPRLGEHSARVT